MQGIGATDAAEGMTDGHTRFGVSFCGLGGSRGNTSKRARPNSFLKIRTTFNGRQKHAQKQDDQKAGIRANRTKVAFGPRTGAAPLFRPQP
jgi:hypothetical protein